MNAWAPLWNGLVDSSIWEEPDHVFRVFIAMLTLKDMDHIVRPFDSYKFARRIHMEVGQVLDALKVLSSPDRLRSDQEFEGRRIQAVEEGWLILNGAKYRDAVQLEMRRTRNRKAQANYRARKAGKPVPYPSSKNQPNSNLENKKDLIRVALANSDAHQKIASELQEEIGDVD